MVLSVFAIALTLAVGAPSPTVTAESWTDAAPVAAGRAETAPTIPPDDTFNEFLPEDRSLGDCISAVQKPGCGSEARGGWRQGLILLAIVIALAFIAWRIVRSARRDGSGGEPTPPASDGDPPSRTVTP